jgi:hypothetical protein
MKVARVGESIIINPYPDNTSYWMNIILMMTDNKLKVTDNYPGRVTPFVFPTIGGISPLFQ